MKNLFKELFIVMFLFVIIVSFAEYRLQKISAPIDKMLTLLKVKDKAKILIVGNSHTGAISVSDDTTYLDNTLNLSLAYLELEDRYKILKYCLDRKHFKTILLSTDADQLGHKASSNNYDMQFYKYGFRLYNNSLANRLMSSLNSFRLQLGAGELIKKIFINDTDTTNYKMNFIPLSNKSKSDIAACTLRAKEHSIFLFKKEMIPENLEILQKIIDLCKSKNSELYLIQTPKSKCYTDVYMNKQISITNESIDSLARKNNIRFLNYLGNNFFKDDDFADFDHLNNKGSSKLVNLIGADTTVAKNINTMK